MPISRRQVVAGATCALLMAPAPAFALDGDMTIGAPSSRVHLLEFASLTCPHCAAFHATVFPRLKADYIDTGRIAFTLREFPTPPAQVSFAMFQLARCGGASAEVYYERVAALFRQQHQILTPDATGASVRDALIQIAAGWGLTGEQVLNALQDEGGVARVTASIQSGEALGINSTPSFVVNANLVPNAADYDTLSRALVAAGA